MACGCNNRSNQDSNKQLDNNKILRLESMASMSIDEIINLSRDGYILDGLDENIQVKNIDRDINIQSQQSQIKYLYTGYPEIIGVSAHESSAFSGLPYKATILYRNSGSYGYMRLAVKDSSNNNQIGELKICRLNMVSPFCYFNTIDMSTTPGIVDIYAYACNSGENCSTPACTSEAQIASNTSNAVMTYDPVSLSAPSITVIPLNSSLRLTWTIPTGTSVFAYRVTLYQSGSEVFDAYTESSTRDVTVTGLTNGLPYTIDISGVNYSALEGATGSTTGTPNIPTPVLTTIAITPTTSSINTTQTVQLTATCRDQNNSIMTCPTLTWTSSNTSKATVSSSGLVTGVAIGSANITARYSSITSNISAITITSSAPVLTTITISPSSQSISTGGIFQLTAVCKDQNNATMTCPTLTWVSSDNSKATVSSSGLVTGILEGTANITTNAGEITSNTSAIAVMTTPPQESGGGVMIIAAVAIAAAVLLTKK